jgi:signal peptidase I
MEPLDNTATPPENTPEPKQEVKREVVELVKMVLLFLVLFWGLRTFVVEGYEVWGPSMLPTLEDGQRIFVFKLPHELSKLPFLSGLNAIHEGDIVVFDGKGEASKRYIKRVLAAGAARPRGKTVEADTGDERRNTVRVEFHKGRVFVNNHPAQEDYLVPEERNSPDKDMVYLRPGEYYVLGDHRSVSKDSRTFGPITNEQIVGKAVFRFWPLSKFGPL